MNSNIIEFATKLAILNNMGATVVDAQDMNLINEALLVHLPAYLSQIQKNLASTVENDKFYDYLKVGKVNEAITEFLDDSTVINIHNGSDAIISVETEGNSLKTEVILPDLSFFQTKFSTHPIGTKEAKNDFHHYHDIVAEITETEVISYTGNHFKLSALVIPQVKLMELFHIRDNFISLFCDKAEAVYNSKRGKLMGLGFEMDICLEAFTAKIDEFLEMKNSLLHGYGSWENEVEHILDKADSKIAEYREKLKIRK